jgi:FixJ family two-component response regulator
MKPDVSPELEPIVYIVDDDASVRKGLMRLMVSEKLEARSFASANEFLDSGFRDEHACLIADVKMPGLTGLELQQKLLARGYELPIIFITGYDTEQTRELAKRSGALGYFCKPIDDQALLDTINWALSR